MPSKQGALLESYINKVVLLKCSYWKEYLSAKLKNMYHDAGVDENNVNHGFHATDTTCIQRWSKPMYQRRLSKKGLDTIL